MGEILNQPPNTPSNTDHHPPPLLLASIESHVCAFGVSGPSLSRSLSLCLPIDVPNWVISSFSSNYERTYNKHNHPILRSSHEKNSHQIACTCDPLRLVDFRTRYSQQGPRTSRIGYLAAGTDCWISAPPCVRPFIRQCRVVWYCAHDRQVSGNWSVKIRISRVNNLRWFNYE